MPTDTEPTAIDEEEVTTVAEIIQTDGAWLPKVAEYHFVLEDIDSEDTNRSEGGYMHRTVIRSGVYHASVMHKCTLAEMIAICEAVKGEATIEVKALAPGKGASSPYADMTVYASKIETQLIWYEKPDGGKESWWQVNYSLVEV